MKNLIKKAVFPTLVFTHVLVRFCALDVAEMKTDKGIDRANKVAVLMTEINDQNKSWQEEQQTDFLAVAVVND